MLNDSRFKSKLFIRLKRAIKCFWKIPSWLSHMWAGERVSELVLGQTNKIWCFNDQTNFLALSTKSNSTPLRFIQSSEIVFASRFYYTNKFKHETLMTFAKSFQRDMTRVLKQPIRIEWETRDKVRMMLRHLRKNVKTKPWRIQFPTYLINSLPFRSTFLLR